MNQVNGKVIFHIRVQEIVMFFRIIILDSRSRPLELCKLWIKASGPCFALILQDQGVSGFNGLVQIDCEWILRLKSF